MAKLRDGRRAGFFWIDNRVLTTYGPRMGPRALAVYCAIAMHTSGKRRTAFVSYARLGEEVAMDRRSVMAAVRKLAELGLVSVQARKTRQGVKAANLYTLLEPPAPGLFTPSGRGPGCTTEGGENVPPKVSAEHHRRCQLRTTVGVVAVPPSLEQDPGEQDPGEQDPALCPEPAEPASGPNAAAERWGKGSIRYDPQARAFAGVTEQDRAAWRRAFPAVDLDAELARAAAWVWVNRDGKGRKSRYDRFVVGWLTRAQDRGGDHGRTNGQAGGRVGRDPTRFAPEPGKYDAFDAPGPVCPAPAPRAAAAALARPFAEGGPGAGPARGDVALPGFG